MSARSEDRLWKMIYTLAGLLLSLSLTLSAWALNKTVVLDREVGETTEQVDGIETRLDDRLDRTDGRLDRMETKLDAILIGIGG